MDNRRKGLRKGRARKGLRKERNSPGDEFEEDDEGVRGLALHWYIGLSIFLVVGLSFVNFLALPHGMPQEAPHEVQRRVLNGHLAAAQALPAAGLEDPAAALSIAEAGDEEPRRRPREEQQEEERRHQQHAREAPSLRGGQAPTAPPAPEVAAAAPAAPAPLPAMTKSTAATEGVAAENMASNGAVMRLRGDAWVHLQHAVDADEITFGAWIYLPGVKDVAFPHASQSMKTIASTKISGCKVEPESQGWGLFVHEWGTTNRQLRLSWTDAGSACHELFSTTNLVPYDTWVSVGFSLSRKQDRAVIFLNNDAIADTRREIGAYQKQGQSLSMSNVGVANRQVASAADHGFFIGAHAPQQGDATREHCHTFIGYLGDLRIVPEAFEEWADSLALIRTSQKKFGDVKLRPATQVIHFSFKNGQPFSQALDTSLGGRLLEAQQADSGSAVSANEQLAIMEWKEHPQEPLLPGMAEFTENVEPSSPGPTLSPEELKAEWPKAWVDRWGEEELLKSQREADPWAEEIREAMRHTWRAYKAKAWGRDDIKPDSGGGKDWCRLAVTMLDGLSTLWLMGLKEEFEDAYKWIESQHMPTPGEHGRHSLFEINIRALGGLLSAYSLSEKPAFLDTARRLGDMLLAGFNTASGIPKSTVDVGTGASAWHSWVSHAVLAEVATVQMEFRYLSHVTGEQKYAQAADKAFKAVLDSAGSHGLIPIYLSRDDVIPRPVGSKISLGAMGDSYYEYLLKQWVQSGKKEDYLKDMWKRAMRETQEQLVVKTEGGLTFIAEKDEGRQRHRMDHLACFVGGMLMMGARTLPADEVDAAWEPLAGEITETCYQMYKRSPSGLAAEYYNFNPNAKTDDMTIPNDAPHNLLRPEAIEAVYYMWYYTGDPKYRRMAYEMWTPFQRHCKSRYGYSAVADVRETHPRHRDSQESFWLAETLKYFYLVFAPRSTLNLEEWVLNTEAQPLRSWS